MRYKIPPGSLFFKLCNRPKGVSGFGVFCRKTQGINGFSKYDPKRLEDFSSILRYYATFLLFKRDDYFARFRAFAVTGSQVSTPFSISGASTISHSPPLFHGPTASVSPLSPVESLKYSSTNPCVGGILPMVKAVLPHALKAAVKGSHRNCPRTPISAQTQVSLLRDNMCSAPAFSERRGTGPGTPAEAGSRTDGVVVALSWLGWVGPGGGAVEWVGPRQRIAKWYRR